MPKQTQGYEHASVSGTYSFTDVLYFVHTHVEQIFQGSDGVRFSTVDGIALWLRFRTNVRSRDCEPVGAFRTLQQPFPYSAHQPGLGILGRHRLWGLRRLLVRDVVSQWKGLRIGRDLGAKYPFEQSRVKCNAEASPADPRKSGGDP